MKEFIKIIDSSLRLGSHSLSHGRHTDGESLFVCPSATKCLLEHSNQTCRQDKEDRMKETDDCSSVSVYSPNIFKPTKVIHKAQNEGKQKMLSGMLVYLMYGLHLLSSMNG